MSFSTSTESVELQITGMDCAECTRHVEQAITGVHGVKSVTVLLAAERARITLDPTQASREQLEAAVAKAGYAVGSDSAAELDQHAASPAQKASQYLDWGVMVLVAAVVIGAAIGEVLGIFDDVLDPLPWYVPAAVIFICGYGVFRGVFQATLRRQVTSHTLMTIGVIAAAVIGEWTTAALIVFFMRFADYLENLTTERGRQAIKQLTALQPATARVLRDGEEVELPVGQVRVGDTIVIRPGERVPVDGVIVDGQAPLNEASITGESVPVDKTVGATVYAATVVETGFSKIRATKIGADTTFGRIVRLVEEAESQKAPVQRFADKFSTYYLPAILGIALLTYFVTGDVLNAVAVLERIS